MANVDSMPAQKKCWGPQTFYGFFENFRDCSHYPCWNNAYLLLPSANICHLLKAIHNTTKYAPYFNKMEPRREIKLPGSNEYLCFETNNDRTWSSGFYSHMAFLVVEMVNQRQLIKYA